VARVPSFSLSKKFLHFGTFSSGSTKLGTENPPISFGTNLRTTFLNIHDQMSLIYSALWENHNFLRPNVFSPSEDAAVNKLTITNRITHIMALLRHGRMSTTCVGRWCGSNKTVFTRNEKKHVHNAPSEQ